MSNYDFEESDNEENNNISVEKAYLDLKKITVMRKKY